MDYDPFDASNTEDPYDTYEWLLDQAPVHHNGEREFWAISRFEDVKAGLMDWRRLSSAAGVRIDDLLELAGPSPLTMDPPRHTALRKLIREPFAARAIAEMEPMVERNVIRLLDDLPFGGEIDVVADFAKLLPVAVICELLGVATEDAPMLKGWADAMLETVPGVEGSTPEALDGAERIRAYWIERLGERRRAPRDDILSMLANGTVDGESLPIDEQVGMCNLVFEAGNATTGTLIGNAILALGHDDGQKSWLAANPDRVGGAVEEFVRWESPVQALMRVALEPVELHGETIPPGSRVLLVLGAANRDPRVWDEPNSLKLDRPVQRNVAFGEGIHLCLGAPLARLEAPIALRHFLDRYPSYEVCGTRRLHDVSMRSLKSLTIRPLTESVAT